MKIDKTVQERIYAGVLGKIIGVYMGRPVEGWSYDAIKAKFGYIDYLVAPEAGAPLIVPDDDISGTFVFYRALEDNNYPVDVKASDIGETWLNYIVEDKTILWWGGLSRSTEHSAYLRLKQGYLPPDTGSIKLNGVVTAEAIGAQIFIDSWALCNPGNPARAAEMARKAATVSHDGIAVECAVYLAAMEAMAFVEKDIDTLLSKCRAYIGDNQYGKKLNALLDEILEQCDKNDDWRVVHDYIEANHNYARCRGTCPMVTNHLAVIMALKYGGDSFRRSMAIACSSGWDTDCNSGNVACLQAIRLGLDAINEEVDFRSPIADRMYVVSTDGGSVISDAVTEARKIIKAAAALNGEEVEIADKRFAFDFPGSTQGFMVHQKGPVLGSAIKGLRQVQLDNGVRGLAINYEGLSGSVSGGVAVQTYVDPAPKAAADTSYFEVYASPSLYSTQVVTAEIYCESDNNPNVRFFIDYYDGQDEVACMDDEKIHQLKKGRNTITYSAPDTFGRGIYKVGLQLLSEKRCDGRIILESMDWNNTPRRFHMGTANELTPGISPFVTRTKWMMAFLNSTKCSGPDFRSTLSLSHPEDNGLMTIGTMDWTDYSVGSKVQFVHADYAGMVARSKGHRRYYAGVFCDGKYEIIKRKKKDRIVLASVPADYVEGNWYRLKFEANGSKLSFYVDDKLVVTAEDDEYASGGCGFVCAQGAIVCEKFDVIGC